MACSQCSRQACSPAATHGGERERTGDPGSSMVAVHQKTTPWAMPLCATGMRWTMRRCAGMPDTLLQQAWPHRVRWILPDGMMVPSLSDPHPHSPTRLSCAPHAHTTPAPCPRRLLGKTRDGPEVKAEDWCGLCKRTNGMPNAVNVKVHDGNGAGARLVATEPSRIEREWSDVGAFETMPGP